MAHRNAVRASLVLAPLAFLALVTVLAQCSQTARWDLTENKIHTLSDGARTVLMGLDEEVRMRLYFSEQASTDLPALGFYAKRVSDFLDEVRLVSDRQIAIEWRDPQPFSEAEDEALLAGLSGLPIGPRGDPVYFGLTMQSSSGAVATIPFLSPDQAYLLEYQVLQALDEVTRQRRPRVALVTDLPIQSWVIYEDMQARYELIEVPVAAEALPSGLDLVLLIQPSVISPKLFEALEAAIKEGQSFLILIDPLIQSIPQAAAPDPKVDQLLDLLGVAVGLEEFVADARLGLQVTLEPNASPIRHPAILGLTGQSLNREDVVTAELDAINIASAGMVGRPPTSDRALNVLWRSSSQSALLPVTRLLAATDVAATTAQILAELPEQSESLAIAARVSEPSHSVVIADVDFLADQYWVSRQDLLGTQWLDRFASNGSFMLNLIDNLVGDPALIQLRSRDVSFRSFELVDELRRSAEMQLLATEQRLEAALEAANQQLRALRLDQDSANLEQSQTQIEAFVAERARLRQELRAVRRDLDQNINRLGQQLTWINILLVPLLILGVYGTFFARRVLSRRSTGF